MYRPDSQKLNSFVDPFLNVTSYMGNGSASVMPLAESQSYVLRRLHPPLPQHPQLHDPPLPQPPVLDPMVLPLQAMGFCF
jgi:hypothetical protein